MNRGAAVCLWISGLLLLSLCFGVASAAAADPPEFDPTLSLTGGCGTTKADPVADPGCPDKKPPKPFSKPTAIAIDSFGYEYVANYGAGGSPEGSEGRIDVFSPEGVFVTEIVDPFGPKSLAVDSEGNLYAWEHVSGGNSEISRYTPTVYEPAEGKIEYGSRAIVLTNSELASTGGVAIDSSTDRLFIAAGGQIFEYGSAKEGNKLIDTITHEDLGSSNYVAVDASKRRLYASSCRDSIFECFVMVFDVDTHELLEEVEGPSESEKFLSTKGWLSIGVDENTGDFFVGDLELTSNVYQFDASYALVSTLTMPSTLFEEGLLQIAVSNAPSGVTNHRYLFVPSSKNRALAFSPQKEQLPEVKAVSTSGIGVNEVELLATIRPNGGVTNYRFEYLTEQEYEEAGNSFTGAKVAGEGTIQPIEQEAEVSAVAKGLSPGVTYRFRVVAENLKGPDEEQATFTTYDDAPVSNECANQSLRISRSALLPDCRAYELVTPPDTNGRAPRGVGFVGDQFMTLQASPSGEAVSFLTEGGTIPGLGGSGAFNGSPYLSTRTSSGWATANAGPMGTESSLPSVGSVSPDQGYLFWIAIGEGSAVIEGKDTHYVRYPDGHSELVGRGSLGTDPKAVGKRITEGGAHIIFQTREADPAIQLESNAPPTGTQAVYDRTSDEITHVVSLLPGDVTPAAGENAQYVNSSADGAGIAFTLGGTLYLRVNNEETFKVGSGVTFAGVSEGGERVFYMEGGDLKALDTTAGGEGEVIAFTDVGNAVPVNVSSDGSRAYFVSTTAIAESGPNPNGDSPVGGQQNLYLSEEGAISFVGTVTARDVEGELTQSGQIDGLGLWIQAVAVAPTGTLSRDPSRLNPDGTVMLFQSRANLDGYDPEGAPQIYRYDSVDSRLHCISCIPTQDSPTNGASLQSIAPLQESPEPFSTSGFVPNLRADGKHAVFQSTEALVSHDNDGVQDVYEWEEQGVGSCTRSGGCIYLISSGQSEAPNYLFGVSQSGDDIFFTTSDVLVGGDDSTLSIYDARVNGGFPEVPRKECEGEGCKPGLAPPPPLAPPVTGSIGPSGNVPPSTRKSCPKGKRKVKRGGKFVCVKKKQGKKKRKGKAGKAAGKGARK